MKDLGLHLLECLSHEFLNMEVTRSFIATGLNQISGLTNPSLGHLGSAFNEHVVDVRRVPESLDTNGNYGLL